MRKYKYVKRFVITDYFFFGMGALAFLGGVGLIFVLLVGNTDILRTPLWVLNVIGLILGPVVMEQNSKFKRKRVPLSSQDSLKEDLKNG